MSTNLFASITIFVLIDDPFMTVDTQFYLNRIQALFYANLFDFIPS